MPFARKAFAAALSAFLLLAVPTAAFGAESQGRTGIDAAAEALRNDLSPMLLTYENLKKQRGAEGAFDIANARVQGLQNVMYDGNPVRPTVTLKLEDATLAEGVDFDLVFEGDMTNPGTVSVNITGKGAYAGSIETGFDILPGDLAYATVDVIPDQTATGDELRPAPVVKLEGKTLAEDIDYTVAYADNTDEGTATIVVSGIGNCTGQQHASFEIVEDPEDELAQSSFVATLPIMAGPAILAAVALSVVALTIAYRKDDGAKR